MFGLELRGLREPVSARCGCCWPLQRLLAAATAAGRCNSCWPLQRPGRCNASGRCNVAGLLLPGPAMLLLGPRNVPGRYNAAGLLLPGPAMCCLAPATPGRCNAPAWPAAAGTCNCRGLAVQCCMFQSRSTVTNLKVGKGFLALQLLLVPGRSNAPINSRCKVPGRCNVRGRCIVQVRSRNGQEYCR